MPTGFEQHRWLFVRTNHTFFNLESIGSLIESTYFDNGCFTLILPETNSLHIKHFLTRGPQAEQQVTWPQGWKSTSRLESEQTRHSSRVELRFGPWMFWFGPMSISPLCFSLWHLVSVLHRLGSGHRSSGVWPERLPLNHPPQVGAVWPVENFFWKNLSVKKLVFCKNTNL